MTDVMCSPNEVQAAQNLPPALKSGGRPLLDTLGLRRSAREFDGRGLSLQQMSNLLWAACGLNRAASGGRTAPSTRDWREIDVYVSTADGLNRYDPNAHRLDPVLARDIRADTGAQAFVASAPANLIYVVDLKKVSATDEEERRFYCAADAGFIAQNVYLYCASEGLATVVRGLVDRKALAKTMGLRMHQRVLLCQSVGFPAH